MLINQRIGIRIELLQGESGDEVEYREMHHVTTDARGQFSLIIGQGKEEAGSFKSVKWEEGNKWLQLSVDIEEKGEFSFMGKSELLSVPYAMYASRAGNVDGLNSRSTDNDWVEGLTGVYNTTDNIGIGTADPESKLHIKGSGFPLNIEGTGGKYIIFTKGAMSNANNKLGWIGFAGNNKNMVIRNAKGNAMTFESNNILNVSLKSTQGSAHANFIFENDGNVRFYNKTHAVARNK